MKTTLLLFLLALSIVEAIPQNSVKTESKLAYSRNKQLRKQMIKMPDQFAPELLKNEAAPLRLDSLVNLDMDIKKGYTTYEYDALKRVSTIYHYSGNPQTKYSLFRKEKYTYNEDGSLAEWHEYAIADNSETKISYKLYDYPEGGKRIRTFYASEDGFKELECDWVDKHGLLLLNLMFRQKGSVDEKNHIHIVDFYNGSDLDPNDKYSTDTTYYDENWNLVKKQAQVNYTKEENQNPVPSDLYVTFFNENMEYIYRIESYTFSPESKLWIGDYAEHKTYHRKEGTEIFHDGQTDELIRYSFVNNKWEPSVHERRDKLSNILFIRSGNSTTEFIYDYRILPDGMRVTEQNPDIEFSSEIIHLDEQGYPSSFTQGRNVCPFERKEEILTNGNKQIEFSCHTLMDNVQILRTLTFILNPESKVVSFIPKLYGPYHDDFYKYSRDYTYNGDTIIVKTYEGSPDKPTTITRFSSDHFLHSKYTFDYENSNTADYYRYDSYERDNKSFCSLTNYGANPLKMLLKYNNDNRLILHEMYIANTSLHPSDPAFWIMDYLQELDYNEVGLMTKNYFKPMEGTASLSEKKYHSLYPNLLTEELEKQWYNHQLSEKKETLYHYSEWDPLSEEYITQELKIRFIREAGKITLIHPSHESGYWTLYSPNGNCIDKGSLNAGQTEISLTRLTKGVYIIRVYTDDLQETIKFIR